MTKKESGRPTSPMACNAPLLDPGDRAVAPLAILVLLLFAAVWGTLAGSFVTSAYRLDQGRLVQATVTAQGTLEYAAASGSRETIDLPAGWDGPRNANGTVDVRVVDDGSIAPTLASDTRSQLVLSLGMFLFAPGMLYGAWRAKRKLREDELRRA